MLQLADKVLLLANALMDGGGAAEAGVARAGAQLLAASACLGSDTWAVKVRGPTDLHDCRARLQPASLRRCPMLSHAMLARVRLAFALHCCSTGEMGRDWEHLADPLLWLL